MKILAHPRLLPVQPFFLAVMAAVALAPNVAAQENDRWESQIAAFEERDAEAFPPKNGVLFIGSSSIRGWQTLQEDFPDYPAINRGFGGSQIADATRYANRIVIPYSPRLIFLYAGENDINAGKTPQEVAVDFEAFVRRVRRDLPEVEIGFISMKPSPRREHLIPQFAEGNDLIRDFTEGDLRLFYVDIFYPMLDADGRPREELFVADRLHLNEEGYALWRTIVEPEIEQRYRDHWFVRFNNWLNGIVWGPPFMILLAGTGLYLTIRLGFFQFTHLGTAWRESFGRLFKRKAATEKGSVTSFQAVAAAMAATVGVGNIAGVSTAIAFGGPGALFWMWMIALVGMATKFAEASLGLKYRHIDEEGRVSGGVMFYIEKGLGKHWKWLAVIYAFLAGLAAFGIGNMVQANTLADAVEGQFGLATWMTGLLTVALVGAVTLGGIHRIARTAEAIVPLMVVLYVAGALLVLILNVTQIPAAFGQIFAHAFAPASAAGGFAGATIAMAVRYGVARGIFSNEAGLGSASIVHAQAKNSPAGQGMWGIWEVFIDTLVVATMTGLVILVTGVLPQMTEGQEGGLALLAFSSALPAVGSWIVVLAIIFFSYSTMLTWNFYGQKSWEYLFGKHIVVPYRLLFLVFVFIGAIGELRFVWGVADTLNGLMAAPNLIALIALAGILVKLKQTYLDELRQPQW